MLLHVSLCALIATTGIATLRGGEWRSACLGCLIAVVLAAMSEMVPWRDWLVPKDEGHTPDP